MYALAATMYRATTGIMPPPALDRMNEDELEPPRSRAVEMNEAQEAALLKALAFDSRDRWQSMKEFREALLGKSEPSGPQVPPMMASGRSVGEVATVRSGPVPTPTYQPPPMTENPPVPQYEAKSKIPVWVWSLLGAVVVIGVLIAIRPKSVRSSRRSS